METLLKVQLRKYDPEGAQKIKICDGKQFQGAGEGLDRICCSARSERVEPPAMWKGWER